MGPEPRIRIFEMSVRLGMNQSLVVGRLSLARSSRWTLVIGRRLGWSGLQSSGSIYSFVIPREARDPQFQRLDGLCPILRQILRCRVHRLDKSQLLGSRPSL